MMAVKVVPYNSL